MIDAWMGKLGVPESSAYGHRHFGNLSYPQHEATTQAASESVSRVVKQYQVNDTYHGRTPVVDHPSGKRAHRYNWTW